MIPLPARVSLILRLNVISESVEMEGCTRMTSNASITTLMPATTSAGSVTGPLSLAGEPRLSTAGEPRRSNFTTGDLLACSLSSRARGDSDLSSSLTLM